MKDLTPRKIVEYLDEYIVGQKDAKRSVAVALRNRWRSSRLPKEIAREVSPKNILLIGPTGVGKTEIARRIAALTGAPFVKVEATKYTEVGYVGRDVESMVRDLAEEAVRLVKKQESGRHGKDAEEAAVQKIAEMMWPAKKKETRSPMEIILGGKAEKTGVSDEGERERRKNLLARIRSGELDDRQIEVELEEKGNIEDTADNEQANRISQIFASMMPKKMKKKKVTVRDAKRILAEEAADEMVDMEVVKDRAIHYAEERGIIFIDEMNELVPNRDSDVHEMARSAVNEMLAQMDRTGERGVFIIGATNYPDMIDPAILRAGRLDKKYYIGTPDFKARSLMFELYLKSRPYDFGLDYEKLAQLTENYVSADLEMIVNDASRIALRQKSRITMVILEDVISKTKPSLTKSELDKYLRIKAAMAGEQIQQSRRRIGF